MRYALKRKADGLFYRGREYRFGKAWNTLDKAFMFISPTSARNGHSWHPTIKCDCVFKPGTPYRLKRCKPTCAQKVAARQRFDSLYEVVNIHLTVTQ